MNLLTGDYEIIDTNAANISACSFCGYKAGGSEGHRRKSQWLRERYAEGLKFKVLRSRESGDIGMIEYAPGDCAWRPVEAKGYLVIHCLMVSGKHKGKGLGTLLLNDCFEDAKRNHCRGVAVVASSDSFMADPEFFLKEGFVAVDRIHPYELLAKKLKKSAPDPHFIVASEPICQRYQKGLTILAADQCPMVPKWVAEISAGAKSLGLNPTVVHIGTAEESRALPTPYGMFSILQDGRLTAGRPISATRFLNLMRGG